MNVNHLVVDLGYPVKPVQSAEARRGDDARAVAVAAVEHATTAQRLPRVPRAQQGVVPTRQVVRVFTFIFGHLAFYDRVMFRIRRH